LPEGACGTWTALYGGLEGYMANLEEHMLMENGFTFPQFEPQ
jgi:regulator of cell morphogenesis and NO signaling